MVSTNSISIRHVTTLDAVQIDLATVVVEEAFEGDALLVALVGGDRDLSRALFKAYITAAIINGEAYFAQLGEDVIGVSCWFGPGKQFLKSTEQREWDEYWNQGLSQTAKTWQTENYLPQYRALYSRSLPSPSAKLDGYNLSLLGVLPALRGRGIGSWLVREGLERAQQQGVLVCLDTYSEANIPIYKHLGFRIGGKDTIMSPWGDLLMTVMIWEPEASQRVLPEASKLSITSGLRGETN